MRIEDRKRIKAISGRYALCALPFAIIRPRGSAVKFLDSMAKRHQSLIPLSHDHHHALALAIRCRKQALGQLNPGNPDAAKELAVEVKSFFLQNLKPHFEAEEKVLFPLIQSHASNDSETLIATLLSDHERIRKTVTALEKGSEISKVLFDLGDILDHHVRQEERVLFPIFEKAVPAEKARVAGINIKKILG